MAYHKEYTDTSKHLVFDIETIPISKEKLVPELEELIARKLDRALKANPGLNEKEERRKIMATDPLLGRIVCIGLYYPESDTKVSITDPSEKVILEKFWKAINAFNGIFIGFNSVRFDTPYIIRRSMIHGIKPTNALFLQYTKYDPYPPHFDVMLQVSGREGFVGLKTACAAFNIPSPKEGAIRAENVEAAYYDGRIKEIAEYCLRDVIATYKIFEILIDYVAK